MQFETYSRNPIVLFDIDGTVTEARRLVTRKMIDVLRQLSYITEIAFVTGSNLEYAKEQLWPLLANEEIRINCHILPCNGTEYYIPDPDKLGSFLTIYEASMENTIGFEKFQKLMKILINLQAKLVNGDYDISFSGHFIQNRSSMINWCPIGRNANTGERSQFKAMDKIYGIRQQFIEDFKHCLNKEGLSDIIVKLGGDTSFDIYPEGWDKTFALKHFPHDLWTHYFIGDRCYPDGNDFEIFNFLNKEGRAWETSGPEETIEIIEINLMKTLEIGE
jgi:phosphomannomutase|tara:strand:- start:6412 stop:7239 length:828 start_codon:yes stop_codon:yes gene_type:complete